MSAILPYNISTAAEFSPDRPVPLCGPILPLYAAEEVVPKRLVRAQG